MLHAPTENESKSSSINKTIILVQKSQENHSPYRYLVLVQDWDRNKLKILFNLVFFAACTLLLALSNKLGEV